MKKLIIVGLLVFVFFPLYGDDDLDILFKKFPSIATTFSNIKGVEADKKTIWSRTDMLEIFLNNQLIPNDTDLLLKNSPLAFLTPELSKQNYVDFYNRRGKFPMVVYKWEIEIAEPGLYFLVTPNDAGTFGILNKENIIILNNGIISKRNSGSQKVSLLKGKNILYLTTIPGNTNELNFVSENQSEIIKQEIAKKFSSSSKEDYQWITTVFLPYVCKLQNGVSGPVINIISKLNKARPFDKSSEINILFASLVKGKAIDAYLIEKHIYLNYPEQYFMFSKSSPNAFLLTNGAPRTVFLQQLIYDGQKALAETYFNQCLETIKNNDFPDKDKMTVAFYAERFQSYFGIGRIKDSNEILKTTIEVCKKNMTLDRYIDGRPDQEDVVTLTQSFDETTAFQIKEQINGYDGTAEQLGPLYKMFLNSDSKLVKRNDGAISLFYLFQVYKNANEKLTKDFQKFCLEKIQSKIDKAKETRDIKLLEEVLIQNEIIIPLPELRVMLMEEYFKNGFIVKALSQAYLIFDQYPQVRDKIISKMILLENISELTSEKRKSIPTSFWKQELKLNNQTTTIEKLAEIAIPQQNNLGKFLKSIPLEPTHVQYWNHPQINNYQPIEPLFTKNNIIFNGGSHLISFSPKNNTVEWSYHSEYEYKNESENGPHQKRFITTHSGNQLFVLTNRDFSDKKTVKCFDLRGELLWDLSDQKSSSIEEPFCTPIEAQGKLFCLSYSNRETINIVNYAVYDSDTGRLISKTPISYIPDRARDEICRPVGGNWNTFTYDEHFTKDSTSVYGFSGTGILFKADANTGNLLWEKGYQKTSTSDEYSFWQNIAFAPSGYIHLFEDVLLAFMPDIQLFTAIDKNSGDPIWKTKFFNPKFIHDRGRSNSLFFSNENIRNEPSIYKVNPKNGEIIWQTTTNGLSINGEGDILNQKLYIPSNKALLVYEEATGKLVEIIHLNFQPIKFRCNNDYSVIFSATNAFIMQNNGTFDPKTLIDTTPAPVKSRFVEPDTKPTETLSFENINLETTLKLPEDYYASGDQWKQTKMLKTSKPFHFLLTCKEHLALFREGFSQKDGKYIPPEILWYQQYPDYAILDDTLYVSEYGKIIASNIFTRDILWVHEYERTSPVFKPTLAKTTPAIAVSKKYIAYQTENQSICILDKSTRNKIIEFYTPSIRSIYMDDNYLVTMNHKSQAKGYDLMSGKEIWMQDYNHMCDNGIENGKFVFVKNNASTITFYDLKTGAVVINSKSLNNNLYTMNNWLLEEPFLFAFNMIYSSKTGEPIPKYKEAAKVTGGGFVGFYKQFGTEGNFILGDKELPFQMQSYRDYDNKIFAAVRKGNRVTFFSSWGIETFEITNEKLVSIDYVKFYAGPNGNQEGGMSFLPLDNSFLMLRKDEMYFFKNFDTDLNFQKIKSCRVENKRNSIWPYSEVYPEIEVGEKNWISYNGEKIKRKLFYQAFADEKFAYLKFKLSPKSNNIQNTLYISGNSFSQVFAITWDADNWKNCQNTFNINENIESWKEIDIQGNVNLYIKLKLTSPLSNDFKNTLPDFSIEMRQKSGLQNDGMFRIGGAYFKNRKFFPWLNYMNDEAQNLKDFAIRSNLYEHNSNFYPPGEDLILWLKDRRRFKSFDSNIQLLNKMLENNSKFYCSVNILTALLNEEILALKDKQPELSELSDEFTLKVNEIIKRLYKYAQDKGVSKEWADFALSFWTIEIMPNKINIEFSRDGYFKAVCGYLARTEKEIVLRSQFSEKENVLTPNINQPYIEWIFPGLVPNFPKNQTISFVELHTIGTSKTSLGRMTQFSPTGSQEFCSRKGIFSNPASKILWTEKGTKLEVVEKSYFSKNQRYDCFNVVFPARPIVNISFDVPPIKTPTVLQTTGQTPESIMTTLENLPSDNKNGQILIDYYISLKGNIEENERVKIYAKWLNSIKDNSSASLNAISNIYRKNEKQKDLMEFMSGVMKEAKMSALIPRRFFLFRVNNKFLDKNARSVLGPFKNELEIKPEINFDPTIAYKAGDKSYRFGESLESTKGGTIYIASKITVENNEKPFLFAWATNYYDRDCTSGIVNIWVNGKSVLENVTFSKYEDNTLYQKIPLIKGENIVLIKIKAVQENEWGANYSIGVGDIYGIPLKGVEMKPGSHQ